MKKLIITCAVLLFGIFSANAQVTIETLEVSHYRAFCEGVVPKQCLVVKRQDAMNFGTIYDEIENFEFIPGFHYKLEVEIEKVAAPPKDTSGYKYRLKKILDRKPVRDPENDVDLFGYKWRLVKLNGKPVNRASGAWVVLAGHSASVYGYGGCNSFRGEFSINGGIAKIGSVVSTTRACLVDWGVEDDFLKELGRADGLEVDQERLILTRDGRTVLEFVHFQ